jgi:hypothetical protein
LVHSRPLVSARQCGSFTARDLPLTESPVTCLDR